MKRNIIVSLTYILSIISISGQVVNLTDKDFDGFNILIANDLGRNGYYEQKPIAELMGDWTDKADVEFIAAVGDVHHFGGVASVIDPLWMTNYELIYKHPELMIDWYPVLDNHEYRGNTNAVLQYSDVSRRWVMPDRYYTLTGEADDGSTIRYIFVDTTPLIDRYRNNNKDYPDAVKQDIDKQLAFIDSVLTVSKETWTVVMGHHPIFSETPKNITERTDLQKRLDPVLKKHNVDFYINGHIHNFQHIKHPQSPIHYFTNSSASLSRKVKDTEGTQFKSDKAGFSILSANKSRLAIYFIDGKGDCIYRFEKKK
ncbi:MAG: acid phosphatase [Porphyromonadaceae bacterium]|nr:acid phosphatase [Porphyromonadaceae bacterium]